MNEKTEEQKEENEEEARGRRKGPGRHAREKRDEILLEK